MSNRFSASHWMTFEVDRRSRTDVVAPVLRRSVFEDERYTGVVAERAGMIACWDELETARGEDFAHCDVINQLAGFGVTRRRNVETAERCEEQVVDMLRLLPPRNSLVEVPRDDEWLRLRRERIRKRAQILRMLFPLPTIPPT